MSDARLDAANRQERPEVLTERRVVEIRSAYREAWDTNEIARGTFGAVESLIESHEALRSRCADLEREKKEYERGNLWVRRAAAERERAESAESVCAGLARALEAVADAAPYLRPTIEAALAATPTREEEPRGVTLTDPDTAVDAITEVIAAGLVAWADEDREERTSRYPIPAWTDSRKIAENVLLALLRGEEPR